MPRVGVLLFSYYVGLDLAPTSGATVCQKAYCDMENLYCDAYCDTPGIFISVFYGP